MSSDRDNLNAMMCLDIYLSSLNKEEYDRVKHAIKPVKTMPLLSWDLTGNASSKIIADSKIAERIKLRELAIKHLWNIDIETVLDNPYEVVVVTNAEREICWVSDTFTAMTGYSVNYAVGRTPKFLQGINTTPESRQKIKKHLKAKKTFSTTIVNYRKNKEEYICEVKIIPIANFNDEVTHYIALEREAV
jgi:PAS domain S-box-containing protein